MFIEYKEIAGSLENEKENVFKNKFVEYAAKDNDETFQKFLEMLTVLKEKSIPPDNTEPQNEDLLAKTKEEVNTLTNDLNQVKVELENEKNEKKELNAKYEDAVKNAEN